MLQDRGAKERIRDKSLSRNLFFCAKNQTLLKNPIVVQHNIITIFLFNKNNR